METLSPELGVKMIELAKGPPHPRIVAHKEAIAAATRLAELHETMGTLTQEEIETIVRMKLELDGLYILWVQGKLD